MLDLLVGVEQVLDHHHRVLALLERLPVEEAGEPGERFGVVVDGRSDVLLGGGELVGDLLVEGGGEALFLGHSGAPSFQPSQRNPVAASCGSSGLVGRPGGGSASL